MVLKVHLTYQRKNCWVAIIQTSSVWRWTWSIHNELTSAGFWIKLQAHFPNNHGVATPKLALYAISYV